MEEDITSKLVEKLKEYFQGYKIPGSEEEIINVQIFLPFELNCADFDNINTGQMTFRCWIKSKIEGAVKEIRTFSFRISGIKTVIQENRLVDLNIDEIVVTNFYREA
ncbi:hypothetical protein [Ulvibacterium sp.]|uniref:hypothetical protein n=1 Tax=Ulvibacterium sp. TaxID=2665914 RepID=UPI002607177C|nr:hypothetical protein [Ulvibacterium sp.]